MTNIRHGKKLLSLMLALALMLSMAPVAFAGEVQEWAVEAAIALNGAYSGGFQADDAVVTKAAAKTLFTSKGFLSAAAADEIFVEDNLTRAELCAAVSKALRLESKSNPAEYFDDCEGLTGQEAVGVSTLASLGVVNGRGPREFEPSGDVMSAELAVVFYRALNIAAGGTAGWFKNLKPGQYGYFEALYLMVRIESFPRDSFSQATVFGDGFPITITVYPDPEDPESPEEPTKQILTEKAEIIEYWKNRFLEGAWQGAWPDGVDEGLKNTIPWPNLDGEDNVLDAIVEFVTAYRSVLLQHAPEKAGIFSDVAEGTPYYDGVMYLCNNGIVTGVGTGRFILDEKGKNGELAALTARIQSALGIGASDSDIWAEYEALKAGSGSGDFDFATFGDFEIAFRSTFTHLNFMEGEPPQLHWSAPYFWVFQDKYLDGEGSTSDIDPEGFATREEMAYTAYELYKDYKDYYGEDAYGDADVNTAVLDRFSDKGDISEEYRPALAYLVSIGALSGTPDGKLLPKDDIFRDQLGVFFSRILRGLDSSKMYDYKTAVSSVIGG